jgi:hypothetical protein
MDEGSLIGIAVRAALQVISDQPGRGEGENDR